MNYRGSYRRLLDNAKAAMVAAIEIYNKPRFEYRDECVVILLLNAWELVLKATLSKHRTSIFYPKKRGQPYRTLAWQDALTQSERLFPKAVDALPVRGNLELLATYRDNAVHFYNAKDFRLVLYALAQTCVKNFRDYMDGAFGQRLEDEINWQLLPLGIQPPVDVVTYLSGGRDRSSKRTPAVQQFLAHLSKVTDDVTKAGADGGRLMTIFTVKLESIKKAGDADVVVGVKKGAEADGPLAVVKIQDPNVTHPLRQTEIVAKIKTLHGKPFTSHTFQALAWKYELKTKSQYCWIAREGVLTRYSNDAVAFIKSLSATDVATALVDYLAHQRTLAKTKTRVAA